MFTLGQEHIMEEASKPQPVMFTAGAVPIINKKGELVHFVVLAFKFQQNLKHLFNNVLI